MRTRACWEQGTGNLIAWKKAQVDVSIPRGSAGANLAVRVRCAARHRCVPHAPRHLHPPTSTQVGAAGPPASIELMVSSQPSLGSFYRTPTLRIITGKHHWAYTIKCRLHGPHNPTKEAQHLVRSAVAAGARSNAAMAVDRNHSYGVMVVTRHVVPARAGGGSWGLCPVRPAALLRIRLHVPPVVWLTASLSPVPHSLAVLAPLHDELHHAHEHHRDVQPPIMCGSSLAAGHNN